MPIRKKPHIESMRTLYKGGYLNEDQESAIDSKMRSNFPTIGSTLPTYSNPGQNFNQHKSKHEKKPKSKRKTIKRIFLVILCLVLIIFGYLGISFAYNMHKLFGGSILDVFRTANLKGQDTGRINILIAGNSSDDIGHQGADLTDSIMIVSINVKNNTAFMLSVPRDLWVNIPGYGYSKINYAYVYGNQTNFNEPGYPAGGMGLLEKIVSQDFNIPIDYYALINYNAIRDAVNAVGGITVNINSTDPRGLYDPSIDYTTNGPLVNLSNGEHTLNGQQALDLARARGDAYGSYGYGLSDFERTANQRMMILALKEKVISAGTLSNPFRLANLFQSIGRNVKTDLNLPEVHTLYNITKKINNNSIASLSLTNANGKNLLTSYYSYDGQNALIPALGIGDYSEIDSFVSSITQVN